MLDNESLSPMNIDDERLSQQVSLSKEEEIRVERVVRGFINVFVRHPNIWSEFKEVVEATSNPVTIPSVKGKEVRRRNSLAIIPQPSSQVIYL